MTIYGDKKIWILREWENWFLIWGIAILSCLMFETLNFFILTLVYIHDNNSFHFTRSPKKYNMWLLKNLVGGLGCVGVVLWLRRGTSLFFCGMWRKRWKLRKNILLTETFFQCDNFNRLLPMTELFWKDVLNYLW